MIRLSHKSLSIFLWPIWCSHFTIRPTTTNFVYRLINHDDERGFADYHFLLISFNLISLQQRFFQKWIQSQLHIMGKPQRLTSCCGCNSLKTGTIIAGTLGILLSIVTIVIILTTRIDFKTVVSWNFLDFIWFCCFEIFFFRFSTIIFRLQSLELFWS